MFAGDFYGGRSISVNILYKCEHDKKAARVAKKRDKV